MLKTLPKLPSNESAEDFEWPTSVNAQNPSLDSIFDTLPKENDSFALPASIIPFDIDFGSRPLTPELPDVEHLPISPHPLEKSSPSRP